jgi:membrane dipeptidase
MNRSRMETTLDWRDVHFKGTTVVDFHAHPSLKVSLFKRALTRRYRASRSFSPFAVRTDLSRLIEGGVDVLLSVIYPPERAMLEDCPPLQWLGHLMPRTYRKVFGQSPFDVANQLLDEMEGAVDRCQGRAKVVTGPEELRAVLDMPDERPIAVVHCLEGAHSLNGNAENIGHFARRGVAYLTLAHFYDNGVAPPCYPYPEDVRTAGCFARQRDLTKSLSPLGEEVVERMVELGMMVDVTHCTPPARRRVYEVVGSRAPIIASHVGSYGLNPDPYNLKDWELRHIADSGGLVGVIFMNYWLVPHATRQGINAVTQTLDYFVNTAGLEHTGVGTDFDGFTDPPDDLKDASKLPRLTQRLLAEGYSADAVARIWGGNALRVLREGWRHRS